MFTPSLGYFVGYPTAFFGAGIMVDSILNDDYIGAARMLEEGFTMLTAGIVIALLASIADSLGQIAKGSTD